MHAHGIIYKSRFKISQLASPGYAVLEPPRVCCDDERDWGGEEEAGADLAPNLRMNLSI